MLQIWKHINHNLHDNHQGEGGKWREKILTLAQKLASLEPVEGYRVQHLLTEDLTSMRYKDIKN